MRAIGVAISRLSFKFRPELGLHAARRFLELSFRRANVSQYFSRFGPSATSPSITINRISVTTAHDSPFSQALVVGNDGCYAVRLLIVFVFHS